MTVAPDLLLAPIAGIGEPKRKPRIGRGFALEHVELDALPEFEYRTVGSANYLALHDIVLEGGEATVEDGLSSNLKDLRNTITLVPAGVAIRGWSRPARRRNTFSAFYFDPGEMDTELEGRYRTANLRPILYGRNPRLEGTLHKLGAEMNGDAVDDLYVEHLCFAAAIEALGLREWNAAGGLSARQLARVTEYIQEHYREELSLSALASVAGLSRFHFARAFRISTGKTAFAYVRDVRLERAIRMLHQSTAAVGAIATDSGFRDASSLRRALKAAGIIAPSRLRRA